MKDITLKTSNKSSIIFIGAEFDNFTDHVDPDRVIIVTDENIYKLYEDKFKGHRTIVIGSGEQIKSLQTVEFIIEKLIDFKADRNSFLLGVGGGVVTDITGFAASIYLRGIEFGFVSTTLLSQVDASVGGKNGVNFSGLKNYIGVFNHPEFVICDISMLKTLPEREIRSGFGEIIKHGIIGDPAILAILENEYEKSLSLDKDTIEKLVTLSVEVKSKVVSADERDLGIRQILNFGHTVGHAIELSENLTHGEAISIGMLVSLGISKKLGYITDTLFLQIEKLIKKYGLPTELPEDIKKTIMAIKMDKKNKKPGLNYILIKDLGKPIIQRFDFDELKKLIMSG